MVEPQVPIADITKKLALVSAQWRSNLTELHALQEKAVELQKAFDEQSLDEDQVKFKELLKESQVLAQLVKQYESTLEVVMSKFRAQTNLAQRERQETRKDIERMLEEERKENALLRMENTRLADYLSRSVQVMRQAISIDDESDVSRLVSGLAKENETLRTMLIASLKQ
eukprot:jgi/Hompol1/5082/HPOL_004161-RA